MYSTKNVKMLPLLCRNVACFDGRNKMRSNSSNLLLTFYSCNTKLLKNETGV